MNCISGSITLTLLLATAACQAPASETNKKSSAADYSAHYTISPNPADGSVTVELSVRQSTRQLREVSFGIDVDRTSAITADGELHVADGEVRWLPGSSGGELRWRSLVPHLRNSSGYDAWLDENWGIFRAEDIIPRARTRSLSGAVGETSMSFELPSGWSAVSEYSTLGEQIEINNPLRRFDQPRGWIAMGKLGIRRETIAGTRIAVAAAEGQSVRRMDMLALLNWILPELNTVLPNTIPRLTIVSAGDPMWRGGLSAPESIYIHADRPLISENATSTLVHELVHVAMGAVAAIGHDWIIEGLAEYYSLELLQRGGAITTRRYARALEKQSAWATRANALCSRRSSGAITALAVVTFRNLDMEIRKTSAGKSSLDNVIAALVVSPSRVTVQSLREIVADLLQEPAETLHIDNLPGCEKYTSGAEDLTLQ